MDFKDILKRLHRSSQGKMLGGVCAGIGETTDTPGWVWRALFLFTALSFGIGVIPYIVLWIVMPLDP